MARNTCPAVSECKQNDSDVRSDGARRRLKASPSVCPAVARAARRTGLLARRSSCGRLQTSPDRKPTTNSWRCLRIVADRASPCASKGADERRLFGAGGNYLEFFRYDQKIDEKNKNP
jgi:hypothetical protein